MKAFGGNADDGVGVEIDLDGTADDGGIGAEVTAPEIVVEDDFVLAGGFGGGRREQKAAERRANTEDAEVIGGDERAVDAFGLADAGDGHVVVVIAGEAGEGLGMVAEVGVVGEGEGRRRMLVALAAGDGEHAVGLGCAGDGMEEGGGNPAEDGAVGPDGEGEGEDGEDGEGDVVEKLTEGVAGFLEQVLEHAFTFRRFGIYGRAGHGVGNVLAVTGVLVGFRGGWGPSLGRRVISDLIALGGWGAMVTVELTKQARADAIASVKKYFEEEIREPLGDLRAGLLLDFFLEEVGPAIYNQAIGDAQARLQQRVGDLDGELYADEFQYWVRLAAKKKTARSR